MATRTEEGRITLASELHLLMDTATEGMIDHTEDHLSAWTTPLQEHHNPTEALRQFVLFMTAVHPLSTLRTRLIPMILPVGKEIRRECPQNCTCQAPFSEETIIRIFAHPSLSYLEDSAMNHLHRSTLAMAPRIDLNTVDLAANTTKHPKFHFQELPPSLWRATPLPLPISRLAYLIAQPMPCKLTRSTLS
jgi:hypothetical protein